MVIVTAAICFHPALLRGEVGRQQRGIGTDHNFVSGIRQLLPFFNQQDRRGVACLALNDVPGLRSGGFATARIAAGTLVVPRLPEAEILNDDHGRVVYVIGELKPRCLKQGG